MKLLATSVIRGSRQGDSHGGAFLLDFEARSVRQVLDWNTPDIDWSGRGWDRGLRGIAFADGDIYLAASDELIVYDSQFRRQRSFRNRYLRHCHEISRRGDMIFLTSTGFDSILGFEITSGTFRWGLSLQAGEGRISPRAFDPQGDQGPSPVNQLHLNSVTASDRGLFLAGLRTPGLLCLSGNSIALVATLPEGTHNAQPFRNGILFNDTQADVVRHVTPSRQRTFDVPRHDPALLTHTELDDSGIARQAFGRGLCVLSDSLIAAGSSPATVTLHDIDENRTTSLVNLSLDIRTSIHGLARWPFD
jgi:hypothetical protein